MIKVLENVITTPIRLWMILEEYSGPISILNLNMAYALNTIPTANVSVAVGTSITERQATDLAALIKSAPFRGAKIILEVGEVKAEDTNKIFLNKGIYTIFDGYINGKGTRNISSREGSSISMNLSLVHKAINLGMTSMFTYPLMSESSALGQHLMVDDQGIKNSEDSMRSPRGFIYEKNEILYYQLNKDFLSDVFGEAIVPHLQAGLKKSERYHSIFSPVGGTTCTYKKNERAYAFVETNLKNGGPGNGTGKLSITTVGRDWPDRLVAALNMMAMDRNASAWNLLVRLSADLGFSIVPTASDIYLAAGSPVGPVQVDFQITPDEVWDWSLSNSTLRLINGLACFERVQSETSSKAEEPISACVPLPDDPIFADINKYGLIECVHFPGWIQYILKTNWNKQQYKGPPWAPEFENEYKNKEEEKTKNEVGIRGAREFSTKWIGHELLKKLFQFRQGTLLGPLRFDILPGTILPISIPLYSSGGSLTQMGYIANVSEVRFALQSGSVLTTIKLSHVRTKEEEEQGTLKQHFLFDSMWTGGGSLV